MLTTLTIEPRFCGPASSGNGGYSCGRLAQVLAAQPGVDAVEVTLRAPPPLGRPLEVKETPHPAPAPSTSALFLYDGDRLVAEARPATLKLELPAPPSFEEAEAAQARYVGHERHDYPTCFVCGPGRAPGDGLRLFAGPIPGASEKTPGLVAAPFVPDASLADETGQVRPEFIWAALDCPGYFGAAAPDYPKALLGRMTAKVTPVRVGERCTVVGFALGREGRKIFAASAVFGPKGDPRGYSKQVWIQV